MGNSRNPCESKGERLRVLPIAEGRNGGKDMNKIMEKRMTSNFENKETQKEHQKGKFPIFVSAYGKIKTETSMEN